MNRKAEQILKVDVTGRVWTPRELREAALDEFEGSGMPATKFAERIGVKYSTFATWVQQRRKQRGCAQRRRERGGRPAALKWVEAVAEDGRSAAAGRALVVHLPCGARMEIADGSQAVIAAALLGALGAAQSRVAATLPYAGGAAC
jgi:hypothetical protein